MSTVAVGKGMLTLSGETRTYIPSVVASPLGAVLPGNSTSAAPVGTADAVLTFTSGQVAADGKNYMVCAVIDRNGTSGDKPSISDSNGGTWTLIDEGATAVNGWQMTWGRAAIAADAASGVVVTVTSIAAGGNSAASLMNFTNVHATVPYNAANVIPATIGAGGNVAAGITPTYTSGMLVSAYGIRGNTSITSMSFVNFGAMAKAAEALAATAGMRLGYLATPSLTASGNLIVTIPGFSAREVLFELQSAG